jgi:hypothetical protein
MSGFSTTPTPKYFSGEDVIGDVLFGEKEIVPNTIPQQIMSKLHQLPIQSLEDFPEEPSASKSATLPVTLNIQGQQNQELITKNIKINLEINLKINVI